MPNTDDIFELLSENEHRYLNDVCDRYEATFSDSPLPIDVFVEETGGDLQFNTILIREIVGMSLDYGHHGLVNEFLAAAEHPTYRRVALEELRQHGQPSPDEEAWFPDFDRFRLLEKIGSGGMGVVYKVFDNERNMEVALKVSYRNSGGALYHFKKEFRALTDIGHPNLLSLYEFFQSDERWFFTMEYVKGVDIFTFCHSRNPPDFGQVAQLFLQLSRGLSTLHENQKLHRDIKPSNVLVDSDGHLRILDFGLVADWNESASMSKDSGPPRNSYPGTYAGTPSYMSPEQLDRMYLNPASDWFAAGLLLGDLLMGKLPTDPTQQRNPIELEKLTADKRIPLDLIDLYRGLTSSDQNERLEQINRWLKKQHQAPKNYISSTSGQHEIFVGRDTQLAQLDSVDRGLFSLCLISGYSGNGKSALIRALTKKLNSDNSTLILSSRCLPNESSQYPGLDGLVDDLASQIQLLPRKERVNLLPAGGALLAKIFPVLGTIFEIKPEQLAGSTLPVEPSQMRKSAVSALSQFFSNVAARFRLVACIDDFQWNGEQSLSLMRGIASVPLTLVIACRSEHDSFTTIRKELENISRSAGGVFHEILVDMLDADDAKALVKAASDVPLVPEIVQDLVTESKGHPYILLEMLRSVKKRSDTASLTGAIAERIREFTFHERRLLEVVSVSSIPLSIPLAYRIVELDSIDPQLMESLRKANLISQTLPGLHGAVTPYHDAIRTAALQMMPDERRRCYHKELAILLEESQADPQTVGYHYGEAGEHEKAVSRYLAAATSAVDGLAFEKAVFCFKKAFDLPVELPLRKKQSAELAYAEALESLGNVSEAAERFELLGHHENADKREHLLQRAARLYCSTGHIEHGVALYEMLLRNRGLRMSRNRSLSGFQFLARRILIRFTRPRQTSGSRAGNAETMKKIDLLSLAVPGLGLIDTMSVINLQAKNTLLALKCGDPSRMAKALALEGVQTGAIGFRLFSLSEALDKQIRAVCFADNNYYLKATYLMGRGITLHHRGFFSEAIATLEKAEEIFVNRCQQVWWELAGTRTCYLWGLCFLGRIKELEKHIARLSSDARQRDDKFMHRTIGCYAAPILSLAGDRPEEAKKTLTESLNAWGHQEQYHVQHLIHTYSTAFLHLYNGDGDKTLEFCKESIKSVKRSGFYFIEFVRVSLLDNLACACLFTAQNKSPRETRPLRRRVKRIIKTIRKTKLAHALAYASKLEGVLAIQEKDLSSAEKALEEAHKEFARNDMVAHVLSIEHLILEIGGKGSPDNLNEKFEKQGIKNPKCWRRMILGT